MKVFIIVRTNALQFDETLFSLTIKMIRIFQAVPTDEGPDRKLQLPLPDTGLFALSDVVFALHKIWSGPALAIVKGASTEMLTVSFESEQIELAIVHTN